MCVCVLFVTSIFACPTDDLGRRGKGGLFLAFLDLYKPQSYSKYELAGQMKDLILGDTQFIPIDDCIQRDVGS